jgi:hypothetical protein
MRLAAAINFTTAGAEKLRWIDPIHAASSSESGKAM